MSIPRPSYQFPAGEVNPWSNVLPNVAMVKRSVPGSHSPPESLLFVPEAPRCNAHVFQCFGQSSNCHHRNTYDADTLLQQEDTLAVDLNPDQFVNRSLLSKFPSPGFERELSASSTSSDQSTAGPNTKFQIIQYNPFKRRKLGPQKYERRKFQRKERCYGLSPRPDALKSEISPKMIIKKDFKGGIAGTECVFGLSQVARATQSSKLQLATSITRCIGACERCRRQKIRCDMSKDQYQPCGQCMMLSAKLPHQPCMRISILDLDLHRKGSTVDDTLEAWIRGKLELQKGSSLDRSSTQTLFLTQDRGESFEDALSVTVSRFEPRDGDKTGYKWEDAAGQHHTMEMPPYFISNIEAARQSIREFSHQVRSIHIETFLADSNPIVRQTFQAALTYTAFRQSTLISDALHCWVATRFIERSWRIFCGGALIGLEPINERGHPFDGIIPVTPVMDTQLDDIVIRDILIPSSKKLLKNLKEKIDEQKRENWLEIYLTVFIMLSNMGWVMKDVVDWTTRHGLKAGSRGGTLTRGYIHTCKTMLAYFHFACNGSIPLSLPWPELRGGIKISGNMTPDQIGYLRSIQQEVSRHESKFIKWKEMSMYDDEVYWCYQMLCMDWRGDVPYTGEIDDFTEEDFLTT